MEQLGTDFNATGSVMTPAQRQEQRRKRGECVTCGEKCFQKRLFKMVPITVHGKVLNGRCLNCRPLDTSEMSAGAAIPAVSRPTTEEDLQRFRLKQEQLNTASARSQSISSAMSASLSTTSAASSQNRPGLSSRAASAQVMTSSGHSFDLSSNNSSTGYDQRTTSYRSLPVRTLGSSNASVTSYSEASYQSVQSVVDPYRGPERSPDERCASPVSQSSRLSYRSLPVHTGGGRTSSRESLDASGGEGRYDLQRRHSNADGGLYHGEPRRRRSNPDLNDLHRAESSDHSYNRHPRISHNPSPEELKAAMERILGYEMDEEEAYALMESGMEPAQILDDLRRKYRDSQRSVNSFDDEVPYEHAPHGVLNRGGAISFPAGDDSSLGSSHVANSYAGSHQFSNRSMNSHGSSAHDEPKARMQRGNKHFVSSSALYRHDPVTRDGSLRSVHSEAPGYYSSERGRQMLRRGSGSSGNSGSQRSGTSLRDELSRHSTHGRTSDADDSGHGDGFSTSYRGNVTRRRSDRSASSARDDTEDGLDRLNEAGPDYLAIVRIMQDYPGSAEVQLNCMEELSNFNFTDDDYDMLLEAGGMEVIADAMQAFPQDMVLQMSGCRAMCNTSGAPDAQVCYAELGAVDLVLDAMGLFLEYPRMQEQGLAALANLAATEDNIPELIDKGCVPQAVAAMNKYPGDLEVQLKGCSVITNLSSHSLDMRGAIMEASGGGAVVLAMVLHSQEPEVQEKALRALRNLSSNNDDIKVELAHMGGIDAAIQAMQVHRDDSIVQEAGASTLYNLASNADNKLMIGQCGGIDVTIRAMWVHSHTVTVVEWCCRALYNLSLDQENRQKMLEVGGITAAVNAMQAHAESSVVQEFGCATLCSLATDDESAKEKIVAEEALDAIVLAMVLFSDDVGVQERACHVLLQLANEANLRSMQASNVGELARAAAERFPDRCEGVANRLAHVLDDLTAEYNSNNAAVAES